MAIEENTEEKESVQFEISDEGVDEVVEEQVEEEQDFFANLAETLDNRTLGSLASTLITDYKKDRESRGDWEKAYTGGLDLLGFKYDGEGQPFRGASSVTHPLLSEAVTQFQSQAYKELLPADGPVKTMVVGDSNPAKEAQAQRVSDFMNYMITEGIRFKGL